MWNWNVQVLNGCKSEEWTDSSSRVLRVIGSVGDPDHRELNRLAAWPATRALSTQWSDCVSTELV